MMLRRWGVLQDNSLRRRANARNVSFRISLRWPQSIKPNYLISIIYAFLTRRPSDQDYNNRPLFFCLDNHQKNSTVLFVQEEIHLNKTATKAGPSPPKRLITHAQKVAQELLALQKQASQKQSENDPFCGSPARAVETQVENYAASRKKRKTVTRSSNKGFSYWIPQ